MASRICIVLCLGVVLFCQSAAAHHSRLLEFNSDVPIQIEGIVTEYVFKNPHSFVYFDVTDEEGIITNWYSPGSAATLQWRLLTGRMGAPPQPIGGWAHSAS